MPTLSANIKWATNIEELRKELKSGTDQLVVLQASADRTVRSLGGEGLIRAAHNAAAAVQQLGGIESLTSQEQDKLNSLMTRTIDKMEALNTAAKNAGQPLMTIPSAFKEIATQTEKAGTNAQTAAGKISSTASAIEGMTGTIKTLGGALGIAFSAQTIISFGKHVFDTASEIHDMSERLGISIEAVQGFKFAAEQSGSSLDAVGTAINKMNSNLAGGEKSTVEALKRAGLSFEAIRAMKPEDAFLAITDAIKQIPDPMEQSRVALELFGKGAAQLLPGIKEGFRQAADAADKMSTDTVNSLEAAQDAWDKLGNKVTIVTGSLIAQVMHATSQSTKSWQEFFTFAENVIRVGVGAAGSIAAATDMVGPPMPPHDINLPVAGATKALEDYAAQLKAARAEVDRLTASQRDNITAALALKTSDDDIVKTMGISKGALELLQKTFDDQQAAVKKAADEAQRFAALQTEIRQASEPLNALQKERVRTLEALGVNENKIAEYLGVSAGQVKTYTEELKQNAAAIADIGKQLKNVPRGVPVLLESHDLAGLQLPQVDVGAVQAASNQQAILDATFDHIETRMRQQRIFTQQELALEAQAAAKDYDDMRRSGLYTSDQLQAAWERMIDAQIAASGKLKGVVLGFFKQLPEEIAKDFNLESLFGIGFDPDGSLRKAADQAKKNYHDVRISATADFEKVANSGKATADDIAQAHQVMVDKIQSAGDQWREAEDQANYTFGERMKDVWKSIEKSILSVFDDILAAFEKSLLRGMLGALSGQQGAFSNAFASLLSGGSGGGTGGINTGTLVNMFGGGAGAGVLAAGGAGGMGAGIVETSGGLLLPGAGGGLGTAGVGVGGIGTTGGATGLGASGSATAGLGGAAAVGAGVLGAGLLGGAVAGKGGAITGQVAAGVGGAALLGSGAMTATTIGGTLALGAATLGIGAGAVGLYVLVKHIMSTAGRDVVEKFVSENFGNTAAGSPDFDALHKRLNDLHDQLKLAGYDSEQLWVSLTQGVGRGNAKQAEQVIQTVTDALNRASEIAARQDILGAAADAVRAWQQLSDSGTASAEDLQAAWQAAEEAVAATGDATLQSLTKAHDAAAQQIADLDAQIKSLQDSVDQEAPEEVMGVIETQQRAQLDALKKERDEAAKHLEDVTMALQDAITDALNKIPTEIDVHVRTTYDSTGPSQSGARSGDAPTATTEPTGEPTRYASTGGLVSRIGQVLPFPVVPVQHFDRGGIARFIPRGADTVPAMLSPGETIRTPIQEATLSHLLDTAIGVIDTMHQMPVAVGAETYSGHQPSTIILQVNGRELGRATAVVLPGETRRLGVKVVRR